MAQWGSAGTDSKGQACKQMKFLFLIRETDILPILLVLPPTSIRPVERYLIRLTSQMVPYYGVVSRFTLESAQSSAGITYSRVVPSMVGKLNPEQMEKMKIITTSMRGAFDAVEISSEDYEVKD